MRTGIWTCAVFAALAAGGVGVVVAEDVFRMETEVYEGNAESPGAEYLTLFTESLIYDFRITLPEEITVFDLTRNRIIVLDPAQKRKSTITTGEILKFTAAVKAQVPDDIPLLFAAAHPDFEVELDKSESILTLSNKYLTYRMKGEKPKIAKAAERYQEFADWSARLSSLRMSNLPPFARIELNKAAAEQGWLPLEVERVVNTGRIGQRKQEVRTTHLWNKVLSDSDRKRIEKVGDQLTTFRETSIDEFRESSKVARRDKK